MSVVSNPAHLNGSLYDQQLGPSAMTSVSGGLASRLVKENTPDSPSNPPTNNEPLVNNNCHITGNSSHSLKTEQSSHTLQSDDIIHSVQTAENGDSADGEHLGEEAPVIDIIINNVVCTFNTRCYLNLKKIAMEGAHVEYRRENGMLNMKLRRPNTTATIWSSGKITCTGSTSEDEAKLAARRIARRLQKLGYNIRFSSYRVVNVLGTCSLPFGIKLNQFSEANRGHASYEPELHPGVTYQIKEPKATLKIFSTGSITVTAPSVLNVQLAIEHIYPLVSEHKMETVPANKKELLAERKLRKKRITYVGYPVLHFGGNDNDEEDDFEDDLDEDEEDLSDEFDSDESQD